MEKTVRTLMTPHAYMTRKIDKKTWPRSWLTGKNTWRTKNLAADKSRGSDELAYQVLSLHEKKELKNSKKKTIPYSKIIMTLNFHFSQTNEYKE